MSFEREADVAREAALAAGEVIARHAAAGRRAATEKSHDNPVTAADLEANAAIGGGEAGGFWMVTAFVAIAAGLGLAFLRKIDWI